MQTTTHPDILSRQHLAPLSVLTIIGMVGCALSALSLLLLIGELILPILIVALIMLAIAGLVATGIRWLPLLGALDALGTMIGGLVSNPYLPYHLTHPDQLGFFLAALLMYAFGFIAVGAGVGATIQNYRNNSGERKAPHWLPIPIAVLIGFLLGAVFAASLSQTPAGANSGANTTTVHMGVNTFTPGTVTISKGSSITLIDDGSFPHVLSNGQWLNNAQQPDREAGAPLISNVQVNGNSLNLGPFSTAGTFHVYCTIHVNMNLVIIVR